MTLRHTPSWASIRLVQVILALPTLHFTTSEVQSTLPDVISEYDASEKELWIYQHDPIEIGHVQQLELEPGNMYEMTTMAMDPPVFVIPNFLSDEECERIKSLASETGIEPSKTRRKNSTGIFPSRESRESFSEFDADGDGRLNLTESRHVMLLWYRLSLSLKELQFVLTQTGVDLDSDDLLDVEEFSLIPGARRFIHKLAKGLMMRPMPDVLLKKLRKGKDRNSGNVKLEHEAYDPDRKLQQRLAALTKIHPDIVSTSENLHVVHYNSSGHYHAHTDSQTTDYNSPSVCEHTDHLYPNQSDGTPPKTRICRFMTILYYLNEPEQGGQTAFPVADNDTYSTEGIQYEFRQNNRDVNDLTNHCLDSNLVVGARKGMAVMWYNHHVKDDWIGELNKMSLHGGCEVIKGEKWIANHWINVDHSYDTQRAYIADRIRQGPPPNDEELWNHQETSFNTSTSEDAVCRITSDWDHISMLASHDEL